MLRRSLPRARRVGDRVERALDLGRTRCFPGAGAVARHRVCGAGEVEEVGAFGVVELEPRTSASSTLSETPLMSPRSSLV